MSAPVLVCFAVPQEANSFRKLFRDADKARVLVTGIGALNAERTVVAALQSFEPERVFTCGFAGALNPELRIGDLVFDSSTTDTAMRTRLNSLGAKPVSIVCSSRIATTTTEKRELRLTTGADVVEMESEAIQAVCRGRQISCVTLRAISDNANEDLPLDFNQLQRSDASLNYGLLALALIKSPRKIGALLRLQKNCQLAAEQLAKVLVQVIAA